MSDTRTLKQLHELAVSTGEVSEGTAEYFQGLYLSSSEARDLTTLRSLAAAMADEMEQHGGEMAFDSLARYRAEMGKEGQP